MQALIQFEPSAGPRTLLQLEPSSLDINTVPQSPTAIKFNFWSEAIELIVARVPVLVRCQLCPPSRVRRIEPFSPETKIRLGSKTVRPNTRRSKVASNSQVRPPSLDRCSRPKLLVWSLEITRSTSQPCRKLMNTITSGLPFIFNLCVSQVLPPSTVT